MGLLRSTSGIACDCSIIPKEVIIQLGFHSGEMEKLNKWDVLQWFNYISTFSCKPFRSRSWVWEGYRGPSPGLQKVALPNRRGWQWKVCCPIEEARGTSCLQVEALMSAQYIAHQVVLLFFGPLLCLCLATIHFLLFWSVVVMSLFSNNTLHISNHTHLLLNQPRAKIPLMDNIQKQSQYHNIINHNIVITIFRGRVGLKEEFAVLVFYSLTWQMPIFANSHLSTDNNF